MAQIIRGKQLHTYSALAKNGHATIIYPLYEFTMVITIARYHRKAGRRKLLDKTQALIHGQYRGKHTHKSCQLVDYTIYKRPPNLVTSP